MPLSPGNAQSIGTRNEQQDAFGFSDKDDHDFASHGGVLAVVADGMGGLERGRQASLKAVEAMLHAYGAKHATESVADALTRAARHAQDEVLGLARNTGRSGDCGTTLVAAVVKDGVLIWLSIGDSRLYRFHGRRLERLTTDHVYAHDLARKVAAGTLTQSEADHDPAQASLTSYLGIPQLEDIDRNHAPLRLENGDWLLLCTDGLYQSLSEMEIATALHGEAQDAADRLVKRVEEKGLDPQDNATAVVMTYLHSERHETGPAVFVGGISRATRMGAFALAWCALGFVAGRFSATTQPPAPVHSHEVDVSARPTTVPHFRADRGVSPSPQRDVPHASPVSKQVPTKPEQRRSIAPVK